MMRWAQVSDVHTWWLQGCLLDTKYKDWERQTHGAR